MANKKTIPKKEALRLAREQLARHAQQKRYPLNMRTTKRVRERLERAAAKSGRSLAQEVERRLERSLDLENHLILAQGDVWSPILVNRRDSELWIMLGNDPRDFPVDAGEPQHQETTIVLKLEPEELERLVNCFGGAPWPYEFSNKEIEDAGDEWIQTQIDLRRGK